MKKSKSGKKLAAKKEKVAKEKKKNKDNKKSVAKKSKPSKRTEDDDEKPSKKKGKSSKEDSKGSKAPSVVTSSKTGKLSLPSFIASDSFLQLSKGFDAIEDKLHSHSVYLKAQSYVKHALPTGILHLDLMMGGGFAPGKISVEYGPEQSGKSSRLFTAITATLTNNILPIVEDAESALNAGYVDRILRRRTGCKLEDLVGLQDDKGNWVKPPFMRYYQETVAQTVFRRIKRSLDLFPDVLEDRSGNFFKIWRDKSGDITRREEYDGSPQAAYFVDSAAALVPESVEDNDEANAMAAMARVFAWGFPLIKARIAAKRVTLFFTNQVRSRPGQSMGDPKYMPGGATFAHNNDYRGYAEPRHPKAKEMAMDAKSGENFSREKSINGGEDKYHYQRVRSEKNKQFTPRRTALMRTRMEHDGKTGDGICETFDCFQYLRSTAQLTKRGEKMTLNIEPTKSGGKVPDILGANGTTIDWHKFKMLVEMPENKRLLQKHCRLQLDSGYAFQLETQAMSKGLVSNDDSD